MNVDLFLKRVVFLAKNFGDYDTKDIIKLCLMDIDMPTDIDGFKYLVVAIAFLYVNPDATMTKHIYPAVAKVFGCRSAQVEASIRRAIEAAWRCRNEKWLNYFSEKKRLTNGEFICTMVEVVTFWEICRNNLVVEGVGKRV